MPSSSICEYLVSVASQVLDNDRLDIGCEPWGGVDFGVGFGGSLGLSLSSFLRVIRRRSPESRIILDKQGTLNIKNPQVISAVAQKRSEPIMYMPSESRAKSIVRTRRQIADIQAL